MKRFSIFSAFVLLTPLMPLATHADVPSPSRYEDAIVEFEKADQENPPPKDAILFIGSSSIRGWRSVATDFPDYKVINRGFGGSIIRDSIAFAERIVLPYEPSTIIFYAGENDLSAGLSPEQVAEDFKTFVSLVHDELPETTVAFVSMKPSPSRAHLIDTKRVGNGLIHEYAKGTPKVDYLDVFNPMLNDEGQPRGELFIGDELHMNAKGYELWKGIVGPYLEKNAR